MKKLKMKKLKRMQNIKKRTLRFNSRISTPQTEDSKEARAVGKWLLNKNIPNPFLLTGKAGTGKTTIIREIVGLCKENGLRYSVVAPTGVAALHIGCNAKTIHSFFSFPSVDSYFEDKSKIERGINMSSFANINRTDVLIIDEISMVRSDVFDAMNILFKKVKKNDLPFGGVKVLLVGDLYQLPPILKRENKENYYKTYPSEFFFNSYVVYSPIKKDRQFLNLELTKIHRQKDGKFINFLNNVRNNSLEEGDLEYINKNVASLDLESFIDNEKFNIILGCKKDTVNEYNDRLLKSLPTESVTSRAEINNMIDNFPTSLYPTDVELRFKVGAQIMFVNNDVDDRWVNGTIGRIIEIHRAMVKVLTDKGEIYEVKKFKFEYSGYNDDGELETVAEFIQYPFRLAWSITIHKSQGLTFDDVIIDFGEKTVFGESMVYVALSRCRTYEGIKLLRPLRKEDIKTNSKVKDYRKNFLTLN